MSRSRRAKVVASAGVAAVVAAVAWTGALASASSADGSTIHACVNRQGGVRIVDAASPCLTGESPVAWNKQGPVGPAGPAGERGPAAEAPDSGTPGTLACSGSKQGSFDSTPVRGLSYSVTSPRDAATGQASGKRTHHPVTFVKEWGPSTPQFFQALVTNEHLPSCTVTLFEQTDAGLVATNRLRLVNASVSEIELIKSELPTAGDVHELEKISFTFQRIEMEHVPTQRTAVDDWFQGP